MGKTLPSKTITLEIFENNYDLKFPNTGQFIDIQTLKSKITEDRYDAFKLFGRDGMMATIIVDTIATFNVMIGDQLRVDLNVLGLLSLDLDKIIELAYIYKDQYNPWYEEWMDIINNPESEKTTSKEQTNA